MAWYVQLAFFFMSQVDVIIFVLGVKSCTFHGIQTAYLSILLHSSYITTSQ